jgi:hypothetical protein
MYSKYTFDLAKLASLAILSLEPPCMVRSAPRKTIAALRFAVQELDVQKVHLVPSRLASLAILSLEPPCTPVFEKKNKIPGTALCAGG